MNLTEIIIMAFALSADAFAVAAAGGIVMRPLRAGKVFKTGLFFGVFQAVMPVLGWTAGKSLLRVISGVDHWVAFGLLAFVGGKMIYESFRPDREIKDPSATKELLILAVATSIDAFAVGITFSLLAVSIAGPVLIIGLITFAVSCAGVVLGNKFGHLLGSKAEFLGGAVLIILSLKILFEHLH